jgi:hypothetical protein
VGCSVVIYDVYKAGSGCSVVIYDVYKAGSGCSIVIYDVYKAGSLELRWLGHRISLGSQRKGNVCRWKPLPINDSEDVTVDNSVYV